MSTKVTVALCDRPQPSQISAVVSSLAANLGVKLKTAQQIVENIPLRVYNDLEVEEGRILVEALNVVTPLQWKVLLQADADLPSVSWNKKAMVMGMSLDQIIDKNKPEKTGYQVILSKINKKQDDKKTESTEDSKVKPLKSKAKILKPKSSKSSGSSDEDSSEDSTILKTADSIVRNLSADLEEAVKNKTLPVDANASLPGYAMDSQNIPGKSDHKLEPGFYNLYLPALKSKDKPKVEKMCRDALGWTDEDVSRYFSKPIVCIARNVDDIDASRLSDRFAQIQISLNCKLRSKL